MKNFLKNKKNLILPLSCCVLFIVTFLLILSVTFIYATPDKDRSSEPWFGFWTVYNPEIDKEITRRVVVQTLALNNAGIAVVCLVIASCIMYTITIFNKNSFSLKWIIVLSASLLILLMIFLITLFLSWSDFNKIINPEISL